MDEKKPAANNILKCGRRTYFFDLKQATNGSTYLRITESWFAKETQQTKRNWFILFKDDVEKFLEKIKSYQAELINVAPVKVESKEKKA